MEGIVKKSLDDIKVKVVFTKPSPDDDMTPEQRLDAIAEILATGVLRLHQAEQKMQAELKVAQKGTKAPSEIGTSEWNFILSD